MFQIYNFFRLFIEIIFFNSINHLLEIIIFHEFNKRLNICHLVFFSLMCYFKPVSIILLVIKNLHFNHIIIVYEHLKDLQIPDHCSLLVQINQNDQKGIEDLRHEYYF